jgi:hypothetical protein
VEVRRPVSGFWWQPFFIRWRPIASTDPKTAKHTDQIASTEDGHLDISPTRRRDYNNTPSLQSGSTDQVQTVSIWIFKIKISFMQIQIKFTKHHSGVRNRKFQTIVPIGQTPAHKKFAHS